MAGGRVAGVDELFARQHGLITREQAVTSGLSRSAIDRRVRAGGWVIVRRGVYAEPTVVETAAVTTRTRRLLSDRAASLRITAPHLASHDFASHELGIPILHPALEHTHVTRPGVIGSHLRHGVKHHLAPFSPTQVWEVEGRRVLSPARTALDMGREHGLTACVVAIDGARRVGSTLEEFETILGGMVSWPGRRVLTEALSLSDPESDSVPETLARLALQRQGYGRPQCQFGLTASGRTAWCDLRLGRHIIEVDGRVKYLPSDAGGLARTSIEEVVWEEKRRQDFVVSFKLGMSRLTYPDLFGRRLEEWLSRFAHDYRETCRLFGTSVGDLAEFRPRGNRPRPSLSLRGAPIADATST